MHRLATLHSVQTTTSAMATATDGRNTVA